jgi:neopullulanase
MRRFLLPRLSLWGLAWLCAGICAARSQPAAPVIDKIDPPGWWISLPDPMLLIHGDHLNGARFSVTGAVVSITRQQISANGHWVFLFLDTAHASPATLILHAHTEAGDATRSFALVPRRSAQEGPAGFSAADVMYLIMPDRFADGDRANDPPADASGTYDRNQPRAYHGGDLRGIAQHLDYLQQLGVTTVWITPVYDNSANHNGNTYHGYSATDMYAVDPHLGTLDDLKHLSDALHARGMKLVLDTVPNHVGPGHPWVADEPTPDWFHGTAAQHVKASGDFSPIVDPHGNERDRIPPLHGWFANVLPDMNQENPLVATYLIQNSEWWIESAGLDGLRIDTFPYVGRRFWQQFHAQLHALYPRLTTVGEVFNPDPTIVSYFAGGQNHDGIDTGLDTPFDFPTYSALRETLIHGAPMTQLAGILRQDSLYPHPERLVPFEGNHDTKRFLSETGSTPADLQLALGVLSTMRGMPQIYAGDEIAMEGGEDPDNRRDFPGGFPRDSQDAFTAAGRTPAQAAMHDWLSRLLSFRAAHPALHDGALQMIFADQTAMAYLRTPDTAHGCSGSAGTERILVVINNAERPRDLALETKDTALDGCTRLHVSIGPSDAAHLEGTKLVISLSAKQISIYSATGDTATNRVANTGGP